MRTWIPCLLLLLPAGCAGADRVSLEELAADPGSFDVADRVLVAGSPLREGRGVVMLCSALSDDRPPRPAGPCVEAEGVPLSRAGGDHHHAGVWWDERRELDCLVVRGMPQHARPERIVLSCVPEGSRP